jgi:hypothetical protein
VNVGCDRHHGEWKSSDRTISKGNYIAEAAKPHGYRQRIAADWYDLHSSTTLYKRDHSGYSVMQTINTLNPLPGFELIVVNQYLLHTELCKNWAYKKLDDMIQRRVIVEMRHAKQLARGHTIYGRIGSD